LYFCDKIRYFSNFDELNKVVKLISIFNLLFNCLSLLHRVGWF